MVLQAQSDSLIRERLTFDNPWWNTGAIEPHFDRMPRRQYLELFRSLVVSRVRRAVVLLGSRRVGKTVLLYHTIAELLKDSPPRKIAYVSVDTPLYHNIGLEQLFLHCRKALGEEDPAGWYVFFDEIQYLKDWEIHLKSLVDSYPNTRFVVSGSAAAALRLKSRESGAGRFTEFFLPPVSFREYLIFRKKEKFVKKVDFFFFKDQLAENLKKIQNFSSSEIEELNHAFLHYLNFGGYPEMIFSEEIQKDPGRFIRQDILDKVLLRDLPSLYGIRDVQELNTLFTMIAYNSGSEFNLEELSQKSGVSKNTLKRYLEYLEAAFLIKILHKTAQKPRNFQRATHFKIYLTNPSLRTALFTPLSGEDSQIGLMVETGVMAQLGHILDDKWFFYARWPKGEVDLVELDAKQLKIVSAIEIKWSDDHFENLSRLQALRQFVAINKLDSVIVTTKSKLGQKHFDKCTYLFVPASLFSLVLSQRAFVKDLLFRFLHFVVEATRHLKKYN